MYISLLLGGSLLRFLSLLIILPELTLAESLELSFLDRVLRLELALESVTTGNNHGRVRLHNNGRLELGDEFTSGLGEDGVGLEELMLNALLDTNLGADGILETADGERHGGELLVDLGEESTGVLALKRVLHIELSLVHSCADGSSLGDTGAGGGIDVEADNVTGSKLPVSGLLIGDVLVHDAITTINHVALVLVGKNTVEGLAAELLAHGLNLGRELGVLETGLHGLGDGHEGVVSGENNVSSSILGGTTNDNGVGSDGGVAIEMGTDIDGDDILGLEGNGVLSKGGEMAGDLVDREASGESNTTLVALSLFLVENLGDLIFDESINLSADSRDITADNTLGSGESKGSYTIFWSKMFYRKSSCATHQI